MSDEPITCRVTFRGTETLTQMWLVAESRRSIDQEQAKELQLAQGFDPAVYGFVHFRLQRSGDIFLARWACSSRPLHG
jgi:hypothetical protein